MNKLPPTPPKPPPSSTSLAPSPSSLPPRPPPSQRNVISILPALPMAHHQKQGRKFPAQGIGRGGGAGGLLGHASLPPKPGIPGKPLPRDTGPIVLTGGKDNVAPGSFSYSHITKRTYSSTATKAESPTTTRHEPIMTTLTPASQLRTATSPTYHKQLGAANVTPPAEVMAQPFLNQVTSLMSYGSEFNDFAASSENQLASKNEVNAEAQVGNDLATSSAHTEPTYSNGFRPEITSQHPNFLSFPHPNFYDNSHENSFHHNRNFAHLNGHDVPMPNGPMSDGYPPYILPPPLPPPHSHLHHMLPRHQHQSQHHQQSFARQGDPYPFPDNMTPPNTGTLFAPPPLFQLHSVRDNSSKTSEMGSSTNPQTPFTPTHSFPVHLDLQHPHPHHSVFPPPPDMTHLGNHNQEQQQQQQQVRMSGNTLEAPQNVGAEYSSVAESNPLLRSISFFPSDNDQLRNVNSVGKTEHHNHIPHDDGETRPGELLLRVHNSQESAGKSAAPKLQMYCLGYYLSDRLADVNLSVKQDDEFEWRSEQFNAHSFILGRSAKLGRLIENIIQENQEALADTGVSEAVAGSSRDFAQTSWADEMTNGQGDDEYQMPIAKVTPGRRLTVLLETNDKHLSRDSFLLTLRWLYGSEDWELDAYLDPAHPKHRTLEWTRENAKKMKREPVDEFVSLPNPISLEDSSKETKSEEVHMLERSFALLAAGTLLGVDEVIDKSAWGIRRWGMRLGGGAFERLLDFALERSEQVDSCGEPTNSIREAKPKYGVFTKHLLDEAIAFLVKGLPNPFKFDPRAPASKYLLRLPPSPGQSPQSPPTPGTLVDGDSSNSEKLRQAYSTLLLSMPFGVLKIILEHDGFATRSGDRKGIARYDIAKAVVHERERRRKYGLKIARERGVSTCSEMTEAKATDEHSFEASVSSGEKETPELENLHWEESVLCTFGHGGNGLEVTRRRKGGNNGGRVLWKVGDTQARI